MNRSVLRLAVAASGMVGAQSAFAGPDWDEICDAGAVPVSAQVVGGGGTLKSIRGKLAACALADTDFEDMYQIVIGTPGVFCARTVLLQDNSDCCGQQYGPIQGTSFDTQLWLFKADGHGLLANDNETTISLLSRLGNASTDGTGIVINTPGIYYIAISAGPNRDPISTTGLIFNQTSPTEVSGPDGPGGANVITGWTGAGVSGPGIIYEIVFCGAKSVAGIPTVSEWGMIIMTAVMLASGAILISRKRRQLQAA